MSQDSPELAPGLRIDRQKRPMEEADWCQLEQVYQVGTCSYITPRARYRVRA